MKTHIGKYLGVSLLFMFVSVFSFVADQAQSQDSKKPAKKKEEVRQLPPLKATLFKDSIKTQIELRGRTSKKVVVRYQDRSKEELVGVGEIQAIDFKVELEDYELQALLARKKWDDAAAMVLKAFQPTFEYIDLYGNNAAEYLLDAASCLVKSARDEMVGLPMDKKVNDSVKKKLTLAYKVFKIVEKAEWYPGAKTAQLKGVQCLIFLGEFDKANEKFDKITEPLVGDLSYGLYWLMKGTLLFQKGNPKESLVASIKSVDFDTKDIDSFPDSLLLSGLCYEHILDYHRARDLYFAAAKLFQNTEWGNDAYNRLKYIMDKKLTAKVETADIDKVFFDSDENMNKKVEEFMKQKDEEDNLERKRIEEDEAEAEEDKKTEEETKKVEEETKKVEEELNKSPEGKEKLPKVKKN